MTSFEREAFSRIAGGPTNEKASKARLIQAIADLGFVPDADPRLATLLGRLPKEFSFGDSLNLLQNSPLLKRCLLGEISLQHWTQLTGALAASFEHALKAAGDRGECAAYIEPLKTVSPAYRGAALCTVHGQQWCQGDSQVEFTVQSVSKVVNYLVAVETLGVQEVQRFVDVEPSGTFFNDLVLLPNGIPHNPFVNSGAIAVCFRLYRNLPAFERFDKVAHAWKRLTGGAAMGFSSDVFLAERDTADRNYTLVYMMKEAGSLPQGHIEDDVNLYLSLCSLVGDCKRLSKAAATLANWGVCPFTHERVFSVSSVRACLSVMTTCGLYDSSSTFQSALAMPLPAKSGVSGCLLVVIPGVAGLCCFSPRLDETGNSVFGLEFTRALALHLSKSNLHLAVLPAASTHHQMQRLLLHAAATGNLPRAAALIAQGLDVNACDFELRTPLHVAAAVGDEHMVRLLLQAGALPALADRSGSTPLDEAPPSSNVYAFLQSARGQASDSNDASSESSEEQELLLSSARMLAETTLTESSESNLRAISPRRATPADPSHSLGALDLHRVVSRSDVYRYQREEVGIYKAVALQADEFLAERILVGLSAYCYSEPFDVEQSLRSLVHASGLDHLVLPERKENESEIDFLRRAGKLVPILVSACTGALTVPDWSSFKAVLEEVVAECQALEATEASGAAGKVAQYSAVLARADPRDFGVAVVSISDQRCGFSNQEASVSLQSCFKPFAFAMALEKHGHDAISQKVANEPSGQAFNHLGLNRKRQPYNPLINSGGLVVCSFLDFAAPQRDRFNSFSEMWRKMTGVLATISHDVFLAEMLAADRNMAIAHLLKSANAFCEGTVTDPAQVIKAVEFYSLLCSITCTVKEAALAAACLANGGVSVVTGARVFAEDVARTVVDIMRYAGCAQDSGWLFFTCGFAVKTGASGLLLGVVPGVCGIAVYCPVINDFGNSVKGLTFCSRLASRLAVHVFEQPAAKGVRNPRVWPGDAEALEAEHLAWAVVQGDEAQVVALAEAGAAMDAVDHDGRTALHVAAGEGRLEICRLLLRLAPQCRFMKDRRGNTPADEARRNNLLEVSAWFDSLGSGSDDVC